MASRGRLKSCLLRSRNQARVMNHCPRDNSKLVAQASSLHDVSKCRACSGIWLPESAVIELIGSTKKPSPGPELVLAAGLRCPDDGSRLVEIKKHGVEIDVCSSCGGVWLDGGELEHIKRAKAKPSRVVEGVVDGAAELGFQAALEPASYRAVGSAAEGAVELAIDFIGGILDGL